MRDPFSRKIDYLRISVTDRCNLRCRYCMPAAGVPPVAHADILSYEELLRVARLAAELGVRKIRLTGGEPLVRKGLLDFIAALARLPQRPELTMTTNGLLLGKYAAALQQAGLTRINVSLDTLRPGRFRQITRRDGLVEVRKGLEIAEAVGLTPLKINMVPLAGINADEVTEFARLTFSADWQVRFIEFMPIGAGFDYTAEQLYPASRIRKDLQQLGELTELERSGVVGPARIYRLAGARGTIGIIPAVSEHFCRQCNRLRLTADGQLRPCLLTDRELDLRAMLRAGLSDRQLVEQLEKAVAAKPRGRQLQDQFCPGRRRMPQIGG